MAQLKDSLITGDLRVTGNIYGNLSGNATTATTLQTARTINGTSFNGSANITTANWGTARTVSISSTAGTTGTSVNGSANVSLVIPSTMTGFSSITSTTFVGALTGHASSDLALSGGTMTGELINQSGGIWIQGGSAAGSNSQRMTLTAGMPVNLAYNTSKRGTRIYSNGIAFADPYNGNSNNDAGWVRHIEETANTGILEIATGDDANEQIVVRQYNTSSSVAAELKLLDASHNTTIPGRLTMNGGQAINQLLTGSGTAATSTTADNVTTYYPAKWTFNTGRAPVNGDIYTIKIPVAGHDYGVFMSVNNGTNYYPVVNQGTSRVTTHYGNGYFITVVFDSSGSAASMFPLAGGTAKATVSGGVFRVTNYYDSNTDVRPASYCTTAAGTAAKAASHSAYALKANSYTLVTIQNANTSASALTLNINSTGAKPIYINGAASSASNYTLPAGTYIVFYNGTNYYFRTDAGIQGGTWFGNASTASKLATARSLKVALGSTTAVTFDGSAAQDSIPVSGTLAIGNGGTGLTASPSMLVNLASTTAANVLQASPRPGVTGTLPVGNGGTGNTTGTATYATTTADTTNALYPVGVTSAATTTLKHDTGITMTGGTLVTNGSIRAGQPSNTGEIDVIAQSGAGKIYLYSTGSSTGNRGIYGNNNAGTGATIMAVDQSNNISFASVVSFTNTTASTSKTTGAVKISGGLGVAGNIYGDKVYNAVWNDYAEYRTYNDGETPYGKVVCENGDDSVSLSKERLQKGAMICSNTFGTCMGDENNGIPIAVAGRALAYTMEPREEYLNHIGEAVCAGPDGMMSIMTKEEVKEYPECVIGYVSAVPNYEEWGTGNIKVDGRVWIKVK